MPTTRRQQIPMLLRSRKRRTILLLLPDSEVRVLLYQTAMRLYQNANNAVGDGRRKYPARRRQSRGSGNRRRGNRRENARPRISTKISASPKRPRWRRRPRRRWTPTQRSSGTPQEKIDAYKSFLRSNAYSSLVSLSSRKRIPAAQENFQKSIDAFPSSPDPTVVLRLALALDKQGKYPEALKVANRAVELTQDNTAIGTPARHERDRLQQLTGGAAPAPPQSPPKN